MDFAIRRCTTHQLNIVVASLALLLAATPAISQDNNVIRPKEGFIFIDGRYVEPPYKIKLESDSITINGQEFGEDYFDLEAFSTPMVSNNAERGFFGPGMGRGRMDRTRMARPQMEQRGGMRRGDMARGGPAGRGQAGRGAFGRRPLSKLHDDLQTVEYGSILVLYAQQRPLILYPSRGGHDLLKALTGGSPTEEEVVLPTMTEGDRETLDRLVSEFQPTGSFSDRAATSIELVEAASREGERTSSANLMVARISYPLTVFAMVVVVLGFGHLLQNRPVIDGASGDTSQRHQVVVRSLIIVALLSAVDLIWTITATNAGAMRELNPLGGQLIENTSHLILFKVMVTGTSIAILYWLHNKPVAQLASWWCCLLLTLLTARWVVFQSMFL